MKRVLVTCPPMLGQIDSFAREFEKLGWSVTTPQVLQTLSVAELVRLVPNHDGWIIGDDPANRDVVAAGANGDLRAAVKWGVGIDNVDFRAFAEHGIPVANTPAMFGDEVADVALGYVIGLARHTFAIHNGVLAGQWPKPAGISLKGKTCGIVGFGNIGQQLGKRLEICGMDIHVYDPYWQTEDSHQASRARAWPEGLEQCDFLCFTCALTNDNFHMLNNETLQKVKPGVRIVNVARGPLIHEAALEDALADGLVSAVALDVLEDEPLPADSRLRGFPQNIFGSHNASNTIDAVRRTSLRAIELLETSLA